MRQIFKNIVKTGLVILISFTLTQCQTEEIVLEKQNSTNNLIIKPISFATFKKQKTSAYKAFKTVSADLKSNNVSNRGVYNEDFGFTIDTTNIVFLEKDNVQSITFEIIEQDATKSENLVLFSRNGVDFTAYKTEYDLTSQDIQLLDTGVNSIAKTPTAITNLETESRSLNSSCFEFHTYTRSMCRNASGNEISNNGMLGNDCVGMAYDVEYTVMSINASCLSSGGGTFTPGSGGYYTGGYYGDNNGGNYGGSNGGSNGGNTSGTNDYPIPDPNNNNQNVVIDSEFLTIPLLSTTTTIGRFLNFLNSDQSVFFFKELKGEQQNSILNYIDQNTNTAGFVSTEAREFMKNLINLAIANGSTFTFDPTLNPSNSQVFNSMIDMQNFLNNFTNSEFNNNVTDDNGNNTKTSRFSFDIGMFTYLNVQVKQKIKTATEPYSIVGITSSLSGGTIATEWTQNNDDDLSVVGNTANVTFTGTISFNCFMNGIGVFFSDNVKISTKFNINTGNLIYGQLSGLD